MNRNGHSLKRQLLKLGEAVGVFQVTNWLASRSPRILMYHRFGPHSDTRRAGVDALRAQARLLRDGQFNVITMHDLCTRLETGQPVAPKTVVITVDDGYADFYSWAYPVFAEFGLPVTVYVTSDFVDRKTWLWPDIIEYVLTHRGARPFTLAMDGAERTFELHTDAQRRIAWSEFGTYCLSITNRDRQEFICQLSDRLGVTVPPEPTPEYASVTWEQLCEMSDRLVDVGGHTRTHPVLTSISRAEAEKEIRESKTRIEERLDRSIESFAYPNGTESDYNEEIKALVKAAGYRNAAVSFADLRVTDDLFELRRYAAGASMERFKDIVFGVEYLSMWVGLQR